MNTVYLKIRTHILNMIHNAGGSMEKIPSEKELCRMFKVSRMTVRRALKQMVDEKYLLPKPGLGTYINPGHMNSGMPGKKNTTIGVITSHGRISPQNYSYFLMSFFNGVFSILKNTDVYIARIAQPFGADEQDWEEYLLSLNLKGLFWIRPNYEKNKKLARAINSIGIPVILIDTYHDSIPYVSTDHYEVGNLVADYFFENAKNSKKYLISNSALIDYQQYIFKGFKDKSSQNDMSFTEIKNIEKLPQHIMKSSKRAAIFAPTSTYRLIYTKLYSLDLLDKCDIVTHRSTSSSTPIKANAYIESNYTEMGKIAAKAMIEIFQGKLKQKLRVKLKPTIEHNHLITF